MPDSKYQVFWSCKELLIRTNPATEAKSLVDRPEILATFLFSNPWGSVPYPTAWPFSTKNSTLFAVIVEEAKATIFFPPTLSTLAIQVWPKAGEGWSNCKYSRLL